MKHFLRIMLLCLLVAALCCTAHAEDVTVMSSAHLYQAGGMPDHGLTARSLDTAKLKTLFIQTIRHFAECADASELVFDEQTQAYIQDIDIAEFNLSRNAVMAVFEDAVNDHPEFFYIWQSVGMFGSDESFVPKVRLYCEHTPDTIRQKLRQFNAEIARAVSYASAGSTPLMQAILVSDYFALNYQYDRTLSKHDAYTLFTQKTGVCQAYMLGYCAVLQQLGIPVETVSSEAMAHTWNLVKINGEWYHVDTTWNDPTPDTPGRACHAYMLRSDNGMVNNIYGSAHYKWVADNDITCTSTKYDDAVWCRVNTPMLVRGKQMFLMDDDRENVYIKAWSEDGIEVKTSFECAWYITDPDTLEKTGSYYPFNFGTMSLYGNDLLYTTYDTAKAYSLLNGTTSTLFTAPKGYGIWQSSFNGNELTYSLGFDLDDIALTDTITLNIGSTIYMMLPNDLTVIEASAFAGTNVEQAVCGSSLQRIESKAFADCANLFSIAMSDSVAYIADDAFSGCNSSLVFICPAGSYAAQYAIEHGYRTEE